MIKPEKSQEKHQKFEEAVPALATESFPKTFDYREILI